ncbi:unnamed protein product [Mytilus edulis]|uniref:B box-type domain-containing protein n=1 Tax=Mytilus edulis TaxID=6550 RepID=A0A8S3V7D1_MYTED|nr:unnamed protein product [Mytilus edulis]
MASNWTVCGICDFKHVTKPSVVWCSECDEGLCDDCKEHHSISKASREHDTVPINDYQNLPTEVLQVTQSCRKHNQKYQIFCKIHDCPCCKKCFIDVHNECKEFVDIDDVIKDVKSSNAFNEIEHTLSDIAEFIQKVRRNREENLLSIRDNKNKLKMKFNRQSYVTVVKPDGSKDFDIKSGHAFDVIYLGDNIIAVTSGNFSQYISLIDIELKNVKKTLNVGKNNDGIALKDKDLIYCERSQGLMKMSLSDDSVRKIMYSKLSSWSYVTTFNDIIMYTEKEKNTVTCINMQGQVNWIFKDENILKYPQGLSVDNYGNVYVIGRDSCNVVVISPDGQRHREILSAKDGLQMPSVLNYDRVSNKLLVANLKDKAYLFDVAS